MQILVFSVNKLFAECLVQGLSRQIGVLEALDFCDIDAAMAHLSNECPSAILVDLSNARGWDAVEAFERHERDPAELSPEEIQAEAW